MTFRNSQDETKVNVENIKTSDDHSLLDFNLDNVSSEDDDFEPISEIVKKIIGDNKNPTKLLDSLGDIDQ